MTSTTEQRKKVFINLDALISRPSIFKMVLSPRGDGKSTTLAVKAIETHDESGKSAVFCRRFGTEFPNEFFDTFHANVAKVRPDLLAGRKFDFVKPSKTRTGAFLLSPRDGDKLQTAVTFCPLSKAGRLKSALGVDTHKNIYIDEYIPLDGRYLKEEVNAILELYRTVDRDTGTSYVLVAGNKITRFNPIFSFFDITKWGRGINTYKNGALEIMVYANRANSDTAKQSIFGNLVDGTEYQQYNEGEFLAPLNALIQPWHTRALLCKVAHDGRVYGLYSANNGAVFAPLKNESKYAVTLVCAPQHATNGAVWISNQNQIGKYWRGLLAEYKYNNALYFCDEQVAMQLQKFYNAI